MAVGAAISAVSSISSASQQKAQADAQAQAQRLQASQQLTVTALQDQQIKRQADIAAGRQLALSGVAGVDSTSGSVLDSIGQTRANEARDLFTNDFMGKSRADNLYASANNLDAQGDQIMTNAFIGAGLKGLSLASGSLLNGPSGASPSFNSTTYGSPRPVTTVPANYRGLIAGGL
jgi:hypothetical protein